MSAKTQIPPGKPGTLDEIQGVVVNTLILFRNGAVGFIAGPLSHTGLMFWFILKKFVGSYFFLSATSRLYDRPVGGLDAVGLFFGKEVDVGAAAGERL